MPVLDASVIVSWFIDFDSNFERADRWFSKAVAANSIWNVPALVLSEVAAGISNSTHDPGLAVQSIERLMRFRHVKLHPVTESLAISAASIAAAQGIRGCDAIYVALAAQLGETLVTFDRQQSDRARGTVEVLVPG